MKLCDIYPFVRQALIGQVNLNTKYDISNRLKTRDCRLFYIVQGSGNMIIENEVYPIVPETIILFQAGTEYVWDATDVKFHTVNFDYTQDFSHITQTFHPIHSDNFDDGDVFQRLTFTDVPSLNGAIVLHGAVSLKSRIQLLTTEYYMGGEFCGLLLSSVLKSVIVSVVRQSIEKNSNREGKEASLTRTIIEYISANYSKKITNREIADAFHFNPSYINRIFKKHTGVAMHEFLLSYRLNIAMELLRTQNTPVNEIAKMSGFDDLPHFTKTFKKRTGKTPRKYREQDI